MVSGGSPTKGWCSAQEAQHTVAVGSLEGWGEQAGFPSSPSSEGPGEVWVEVAGAQPRDCEQALCATGPVRRPGCSSVLCAVGEGSCCCGLDGLNCRASWMQVVILPGRPQSRGANTRQIQII